MADEVIKPRLQTSARTVEILLAIARYRDGATVKELMTTMQVPRQVIYNLLHTLLDMRAVRRVGQQRFALGVGLLPVVSALERDSAIDSQLVPIVSAIARQTGETAYVVGWFDNEIMVLGTARGSNPVHVAEVSLGYSGFAHARASGKLLLAYAPDEARQSYLACHPLEGRTANTILEPCRLDAELAKVREAGCAFEQEEFLDGLCCIALPVPYTNGSLCVGLSAPRDRFFANQETYVRQIVTILADGQIDH